MTDDTTDDVVGVAVLEEQLSSSQPTGHRYVGMKISIISLVSWAQALERANVRLSGLKIDSGARPERDVIANHGEHAANIFELELAGPLRARNLEVTARMPLCTS